MIESLINKKAKFVNASEQSVWVTNVQSILTTAKMANLCSCTERTIRDWKNGKTSMPYQSLLLLAKAAHLEVPDVLQIDRYAHTKMAGQRGSRVVMEKYGRVPVNEKVRKESWQKWWNEGGKDAVSDFFTKEITIPTRNEELAEFMGIMLGDGGLTRYQVTVTLHAIDDKEYGVYVKSFMQKLFSATPSLYFRTDSKAFCIVIARKKAVSFLCSQGLLVGNKVKHQIKIPDWILENKKYSLACMRGLMDTDGSMYTHRYTIAGKEYKYKKLCFSSASAPLRKDVLFILHRFGSTATCSGTNVRIDAVADVVRYMKIIGTHNPKHLKRYTK